MDRELLDFLNQQFGDVRDQIQGLRQETVKQFEDQRKETAAQIEGLRQETAKQFEDQRKETAAQIEGLRQETAQQFQGLRQETAGQIDGLRQETSKEIRGLHVLIEGLRGDIQLVAEGVAGVNEKLDSSRKEGARELRETQADSRLGEQALSLRMDRTENRILDVETRVVHLEATRPA